MNKFFSFKVNLWKRMTVLCVFLLSFSTAAIFAQQQTVTGTVSDKDGPMPGVSITVKGTAIGTSSDIDGKYQITVPDENSVLRFSFLGYLTKEIMVGNQRIINADMEEDSQKIDEVVVVGYGAQRKINLTGAVHSVDVDKALNSRPIADVGRSLQGTTPGLSITIPSGEVGSDPTIRIRGQIASIASGASSAPLILLDNVEIASLTMVNPDDIESISVLKDAAASSIYGAKAALGVILITTKKGAKTESVTVSYSNNFAWSKTAKPIEMGGIDALEYSIAHLDRVNGASTGTFWLLNQASFERSKKWVETYGGKIGPDDPVVYGRDWYWDGQAKRGVRIYNAYDYMVAEWNPTMTHNLSVNGKTGNTGYNIALGYFNQSGTMKTAKKDNFERYNFSTRLSSDINDYLTVRSGVLFSQRAKNYPYITNSTATDPWLYIYRWGPTHAFGKDEYGNNIRGPAQEAADANTAVRQDTYVNISAGATVNITKNWTFDIDYTYAFSQFYHNRPGTKFTAATGWAGVEEVPGVFVNEAGQEVSSTAPEAMQKYKLPFSTYTAAGGVPDHIRRDQDFTKANTFNAFSTYNLKLEEHHDIKFLAGTNIVYSKRETHWAQRTELLDIIDPQFDKAIGTNTTGGASYWESQVGFFGRINYAFNNKYLAEANLRYDGSSKFPVGLKWRMFPSFSAGWIISEEVFMENLKPALTLLKIRGSWGVIGDQTVSNSLYVPTLSYVPNGSWLSGGVRQPFYGTPVDADGNITWQDFETLDLGVDARFFGGRLGVVFDWYQRTTKNMISAGLTLPFSTGIPAPQGNYSELRTRGVEVAIDFNHRFSNGLSLNFLASFADATTEITKYDDSALRGLGAASYWKGKRMGDVWGYEVERLYQKDDFEYNADDTHVTVAVPVDPANPTSTVVMNKLKDESVYQPFTQGSGTFKYGPGDVKYKDQNGDGRVNQGSNVEGDSGDKVVIGNSYPRYQYGFRVGADYKGFDFSMFFQGVGLRKIWGTEGALSIPGYNASDGAVPQTFAGDFWREDRTGAYYPRPWNFGSVWGTNTDMYNTCVNDRLILNMAYLRLKNVTLGYTLPSELLHKVYLSKARIYVSLENFFTFDKLRGLPIDPEEQPGFSMWASSSYNSDRTGVGAPIFKNASVGLQITF